MGFASLERWPGDEAEESIPSFGTVIAYLIGEIATSLRVLVRCIGKDLCDVH